VVDYPVFLPIKSCEPQVDNTSTKGADIARNAIISDSSDLLNASAAYTVFYEALGQTRPAYTRGITRGDPTGPDYPDHWYIGSPVMINQRITNYDAIVQSDIPVSNLYAKAVIGSLMVEGYTDSNGYIRLQSIETDNPAYPAPALSIFPTISLSYRDPQFRWRIESDDADNIPIQRSVYSAIYILAPGEDYPDDPPANLSHIKFVSSARKENEIHRAANYFFNVQSTFPKHCPTGGYKMIAYDTPNSSFLGFFAKPSAIELYPQPSYILGTTLHELSHGIHYNYSPNDFQFPEDGLLIESFASYAGWHITREYYKSIGWPGEPDGLYSAVSAPGRQGWWKDDSTTFGPWGFYKHGWYSPLFIDLTDTYNQKVTTAHSQPNDNIQGFPATKVWNVIKNTTSWPQCKTKLQGYTGTYYTANDFNMWIADFDYWIANN
jgi:hypothetical protein